MTQFTATSTALDVAAALSPQIRGKSILLTGPSLGGIGIETALSIASQAPRLLILAGRSQSKLDAVVAEISRQYPASAGALRTLQLDLESLQSVRAAAATVMGWPEVGPLDVVIANAGIMALSFKLSQEGYEIQFAANHLGHFLLVNLLMPKLRASASPTVVNVASMAHAYGGVRFEDLNFEDGKSFDGWTAYGQSKTANMLFAVSLAERGLRSFSLHPGIISTNLMREMPSEELSALTEQVAKQTKIKNLREGAATTIVAAFDPSIADRNGGYLDDCQLATPAPYASDPELARKLWELSEKILGEKFE
jgi:NAD(P)-dependent dehydrogenase (short-subunit alcohol dehydrogenase family)